MDPNHAKWRKSRRSGVSNCVEVAFVEDQVAVRDSKDPGGPVLVFSVLEWRAFIQAVRDGDFDRMRPGLVSS